MAFRQTNLNFFLLRPGHGPGRFRRARCPPYQITDPGRLLGYYLDAGRNRLGILGSGVPEDVRGIEAVVTVWAPLSWTRIFGLDSWPVTRQESLVFEVDCPDGQSTPPRCFPFAYLPLPK